MAQFMRESDALSWYLEGDPVLRSTVVAVAWLDRSPVWETLAGKVEQATRFLPAFRQRVVELPARLTGPGSSPAPLRSGRPRRRWRPSCGGRRSGRRGPGTRRGRWAASRCG